MPKETYYNLPEEKRMNLLNVIIDEFAEHDYKSASISKVCEKAGITKGSFYQYFDNKKDMYMYLLVHIGESKMAYFAKYQDSLDMSNTFDYLRMLYAMGVEFTYNHPKLYQVGKLFMNMSAKQKKEFLGEQADQNDEYLANMFRQGQASGIVREDLDAMFLVRMLTDLSTSISEYYMFNLCKEDVDKDTFLNIANNMIDVLEHGIRAK